MLLTAIEARIIGCLLEKEVITPELYPLSLNALTLACNQKSSRDPVMELTDTEVLAGLEDLTKKHLVSELSGFGSRVVKYSHRFCNTEFSDLQVSNAERALLCLLLLRGAQTAGELRSRANRLHEFGDSREVEACLTALARRDTPLLYQLPREPGKRECRFALSIVDPQDAQSDTVAASAAVDRLALLEARIAALEARLDTLESGH